MFAMGVEMKTTCLGIAFLVSVASTCLGHGINGHINVTQWSLKEAEQSVNGERRTVGMQWFGSAFPDTGYAVSHAYGEVTHWTPFLSAFIDN